MKIKILLCLFIPVLISCSSVFNGMDLKNVYSVKISWFENYYEEYPTHSVEINNYNEIRNLLKYLKRINIKWFTKDTIHNFTMTKVKIELHNVDSVKIIYIVNNKLEIDNKLYFTDKSFWITKFINQINEY